MLLIIILVNSIFLLSIISEKYIIDILHTKLLNKRKPACPGNLGTWNNNLRNNKIKSSCLIAGKKNNFQFIKDRIFMSLPFSRE